MTNATNPAALAASLAFAVELDDRLFATRGYSDVERARVKAAGSHVAFSAHCSRKRGIQIQYNLIGRDYGFTVATVWAIAQHDALDADVCDLAALYE